MLSRRAASSMANCPRGNWSSCPNAYFKDRLSKRVRKLQWRSCFSNTTSYNDDLYTGACMFEAPGSLIVQSNQCFWSTAHNSTWITKVQFPPGRYGNDCSCPVSVHSVKDPREMLKVRRAVQRICGYAVGREEDLV